MLMVTPNMLLATSVLSLGLLSESATKFANSLEEVDEVIKTHSYAMILLSRSDGCPSCHRYEQILQENLEELEDMYQCSLTIVRDNDELVQRYGIESIPHIMMFREGIPATYPTMQAELSVEELFTWVSAARTTRIMILDDAIFERFTQTSRATAGDWVVAFISARTPALTAKFEGFEAMHRFGTTYFALVDYTRNVGLKQRFNITEDTLLCFSEGEMYRFPGLEWNTAAVMDFIEHYEERAEPEEIPLESSMLVDFLETVLSVLHESLVPSILQFTADLRIPQAVVLLSFVIGLVLVSSSIKRGVQKKEKSQ